MRTCGENEMNVETRSLVSILYVTTYYQLGRIHSKWWGGGMISPRRDGKEDDMARYPSIYHRETNLK